MANRSTTGKAVKKTPARKPAGKAEAAKKARASTVPSKNAKSTKARPTAAKPVKKAAKKPAGKPLAKSPAAPGNKRKAATGPISKVKKAIRTVAYVVKALTGKGNTSPKGPEGPISPKKIAYSKNGGKERTRSGGKAAPALKAAPPAKKAAPAVAKAAVPVPPDKVKEKAPAKAPRPAPQPAKARPGKEKVQMEFFIRSAPTVLFELLSTPSGFAEWYCDDVDMRGDQYTFKWQGEEEETTMIGRKLGEVIRFKRNNDEDENAYFEFRVRIDDMTNEVALIVTDHAWPHEVEETRNLWSSQIANLMRVLGA